MTAPTVKTCFKCGAVKPLDEFYRHPEMLDGHLGKCKDCTKRDVAARSAVVRPERAAYERERFQRPERKRKVREYVKRHVTRHPDRASARRAVNNAVRDGRLTRHPCAVCGATERVQAHHADYSKPLDVEWLCFKHHREHAHGQHVEAP